MQVPNSWIMKSERAFGIECVKGWRILCVVVNDLWDGWTNLGETFRGCQVCPREWPREGIFWKNWKIKKLTFLASPVGKWWRSPLGGPHRLWNLLAFGIWRLAPTSTYLISDKCSRICIYTTIVTPRNNSDISGLHCIFILLIRLGTLSSSSPTRRRPRRPRRSSQPRTLTSSWTTWAKSRWRAALLPRRVSLLWHTVFVIACVWCLDYAFNSNGSLFPGEILFSHSICTNHFFHSTQAYIS